jgi:hypothetical protein
VLWLEVIIQTFRLLGSNSSQAEWALKITKLIVWRVRANKDQGKAGEEKQELLLVCIKDDTSWVCDAHL